MSLDADWDIEEYKVASESKEQWKLRRDFMERWKTDIPEDRLVCLARVFANVEFLGCRYPLPVMKQVAELSKEVASDYREKKKTKLQRTFVSASDAAEERARGTKRSFAAEPSPMTSHQPKKMTFVQAQARPEDNPSKKNHFENHIFEIFKPSTKMSTNPIPSRYNRVPAVDNRPNDNLIRNRYRNLILYDRLLNGRFAEKISSSCQTSKVPVDWKYHKDDLQWTCKCIVNEVEIAEAAGETQKISKESSAKLSWEILQKECYTIITIQKHVSKEDKKISSKDVQQTDNKPLVDALDVKVESAVASRMMKLMGWKGGGLGSSGDGINEPIAPNLKQIHRAGLGSSSANSAAIKNALKQTILEFKDTGSADYDLVFANDFTKEERVEMHKLALRFHLKSKSYGRDDERYLVISKAMSPVRLIQSLIEKGGSNDKYSLLPPTG